MTRLTWIGGIAATMIVAALVTTATAHADDGFGDDTLVYTTCEQGTLDPCGTRVIGTQCSYTWGFDIGIIAKVIGIEYSGQKCAGSVTYTLYKNYKKGENDFGTCVSYPHSKLAPRDATEFPSEEDGYEDAATC